MQLLLIVFGMIFGFGSFGLLILGVEATFCQFLGIVGLILMWVFIVSLGPGFWLDTIALGFMIALMCLQYITYASWTPAGRSIEPRIATLIQKDPTLNNPSRYMDLIHTTFHDYPFKIDTSIPRKFQTQLTDELFDENYWVTAETSLPEDVDISFQITDGIAWPISYVIKHFQGNKTTLDVTLYATMTITCSPGYSCSDITTLNFPNAEYEQAVNHYMLRDWGAPESLVAELQNGQILPSNLYKTLHALEQTKWIIIISADNQSGSFRPGKEYYISTWWSLRNKYIDSSTSMIINNVVIRNEGPVQ